MFPQKHIENRVDFRKRLVEIDFRRVAEKIGRHFRIEETRHEPGRNILRPRDFRKNIRLDVRDDGRVTVI